MTHFHPDAVSVSPPRALIAPCAPRPQPAQLRRSPMKINLVLAGGVSLGAYAAGGFAPLQEAGLVPSWIAASSVGAVNAAIIAGNRPERRGAKLRRFWQAMSQSGLAPGFLDALVPQKGPLRELHHLASAVGTRLFGQANSFLPDPFRQE